MKAEDVLNSILDKTPIDETDTHITQMLIDQADTGARIADVCDALHLTREVVRYSLLLLQAAGIVGFRKVSRSERRYYLRLAAWQAGEKC